MRETLEACLIRAVRTGQTLTYAELAAELALRPPHTIHRTALLLEDLMRDQTARGEPQLASIVVSKARAGLPAPGFFILMRELGVYDGPDTGQAARAFVEKERIRCQKVWQACSSTHHSPSAKGGQLWSTMESRIQNFRIFF